MISEFGKVFIFLIIGAVFVAGGIITNTIIRPKKPTKEKLSTYECGEEPVGSPWVKFNIRFFVVALIFVLFDVEIVFLFPWAVVFKEMGMMAFWEMAVFLLILIVGFAYVWGKGDLTWQRPAPIIPDMATFVSHQKPRLKPGTPPAPKAEPVAEQTA